MADDYYMQWLGIGPGARPPDHYVLLSLPRFVNSPRAVKAAAAAQLAKLDRHAINPDREKADAATALMNDVAAARATLMDDVQRAAYDRQLASKLGLTSLPSSNTADMAETAVGETVLAGDPPDLADLAAAEGAPEPIIRHIPEDTDFVPASLFAGQAPLQEIDPSFIPPHSRRTSIPFSVLMLFGAFALLLITGIIVIGILVFRSDGSTATQPIRITAPPKRPQPPPKPAPPPSFDFADRFEDGELGAAYEIRSGSTPQVGVHDGKLLLGAAGKGTVRVDVAPHDQEVLFRRATVKLKIEQGVSFGMGIATAARLAVTRTEEGLEVRATPGRPSAGGATGWPRPPEATITTVDLSREDGSVVWRVNGRKIGTSPEMKPKAWPSLVLTSNGPEGQRVAIESIEITYDP